MDPIIVLPREHAQEKLSSYVLVRNDWTFHNLTEQELTYLIRFAPQKAQCFWRKVEGIEGIEGMEEISELTNYPFIEKAFTKPTIKCQSPNSEFTVSKHIKKEGKSTQNSAFFLGGNLLLTYVLSLVVYVTILV